MLKKADGGVLFLDEVGNLDLKVQKMLLTFLDHGSFYRMGDYKTEIKSDVKIIFGTNSDLEELVANYEFAQELYERIHQRVFKIPPLRERPEDIKYLVKHFLENLIEINEYPIEVENEAMSTGTVYVVQNHSFEVHGNVE